ncbi:MAG: methyl-accepting chemotaxis protein [Chloroflexi bacterium]|nr:methyl-accepting chemotaxis protein [Chloroflexota bacterium]
MAAVYGRDAGADLAMSFTAPIKNEAGQIVGIWTNRFNWDVATKILQEVEERVAEESSAATEQVSASAEEMTAQVHQIGAQADELATTAGRLRELVAQFKVESAPVAADSLVTWRYTPDPHRPASERVPAIAS